MSRRTHINQFLEEREILDKAIAAKGIRLDFPTRGAAIHFRQQAYKFRKLFREKIDPAVSPYDKLTIPMLGPDDTFVEIRVKSINAIISVLGETPKEAPVEPDDELLDIAKQIGRDILG